MNDGELLEWVVSILRKTEDIYLRDAPVPFSPETRLRSDAGIDSIGRIAALYALADAMGVEPEESAVAGWMTFADVLAWTRRFKP